LDFFGYLGTWLFGYFNGTPEKVGPCQKRLT
jgi:hypothetical protein